MTTRTGGPRKPRGLEGAPEKLLKLRRRGASAPTQLYLLLDAIETLGGPRGPLAWEVSRAPDLHVSFQTPEGRPLACIQIRKGRVTHHGARETAPTRVTLPEATARRVLEGHPAGVLIETYLNGEARVEGEVPPFLALLALLEGLAPHLESREREGSR